MEDKKVMPFEKGLEHGLDFLAEGYKYILNRRISLQSDIFETRLLGQKAICMGGEEAASLFYDADKFKRDGAMPNRVQQTLVGKGGVQGLDGFEHTQRKQLFMSLMSKENLERMDKEIEYQLEKAVEKWKEQSEIILYDEAKELLVKAACAWAGVPLQQEEIKRRTEQITSMFESPMAFGPSHWRGRNGRNLAEKWIRDLIRQVRNGEIQVEEHTALYTFSQHKDAKGEFLPVKIAAVEILNIIRPISAISIYISFIALTLHQYPELKEKIKTRNSQYCQYFVQEVRRFYPFFPIQGAIVKKDFNWKGYEFKKGTLTILDLYGTNHDPKLWENPSLFQPERFENWKESPFSFIPQGGGDYLSGHRCAGEWITIRIMKIFLNYFVNELKFEVPPQDFSYRFNRMPTLPVDGFIMKNIQ